MAGPPPVEDEAGRLDALQAYRILDTLPDPAFHRIISLASRWMNTPIAAISFIDQDRQWFKARIGLSIDQTPRDDAFCAHAIQASSVFTVEDATQDERFADNPLVLGPPGIRFYAGAPLTVPGGHRVGTVCVIDTEPRGMTNQERHALLDLADIVVSELELRKSVNVMREKTERLDQLQRSLAQKNIELERFAYSASHDIQQPLRVIDGFLGMLRDEYGSTLDETALEYIDFAQDGAKRLAQLTEHLLTYARAARPVTNLSSLPLDAILTTVVRDLDDVIRSTGGRVTHGPLPQLAGSVPRLYQLLLNLVRNGLTFHRPDVPPEVHVSATRVGNDWDVRVDDNGIGIEPLYRERVFVPFERLHPQSQFDGSGLGLATVKRVAEQHNATVRIEGRDGPGCRVIVTFRDTAL